MIDTHCHIDLYDRPLEIATEAERNAVKTIAVTYLPSHFAMAFTHLSKFKHVHPALGLHPLAAKEHAKEFDLFTEYLPRAEYIGEVGLDFSGTNATSRAIQEKSFAMVVSHIQKTRKVTTVHSRGAENATLDMLRSGNACPVIFHWFSGSKGQLKSLLDQGHRISFNTSMPVTAKWGELIRYVPRNAILTETDGPFAKVGSRPAAPGDVKAVISWLSEIWKLSVFDAERQISENFKRLLADLGHASTDRS